MTLTAVLEKAGEGGFTIYLKEFPGVRALDNVNFVIPSSASDFSRVGVSIDVAKFGRVSIELNGTCAIDGEKDVSGTMTIGFRF